MLTGLLSLRNESRFEWWPSSWNHVFLWHSHNYTTVTSAIASLFTHANWEHVFENILLLWMMGKQLFVAENNYFSQQRRNHRRTWTSWTSPLAFLWIYLGSQFFSVVGCRIICHFLDREWSRMVANDRALWSWQWVPFSLRDTWFTLSHAQQAIELRAWQYTPIIGSSAAVFGIVGAHVYAALGCTNHPAEMDIQAKTIWLVKIGMELSETPLSLEQISMQKGGDNIDHASHFCGCLSGFFLALVWDRVFHGRKYESRIQDV
jgi:membrane associated rhomboid family serine protease